MEFLTVEAMNKLNNIDETITDIKNELYGDLKGELKPGYYDTSGNFKELNEVDHKNWYHYEIYPEEKRDFILEYNTEITLRLLIFTATGTFITSEMISNGGFKIPDNCYRFIINIPFTDAIPVVAPDHEIPNIDAIKSLFIRTTYVGLVSKVLTSEPGTGFYGSTHGRYTANGTWNSFLIPVGSELSRRFMLMHSSKTGPVRILYYTDDVFTRADSISTNTVFTIPDEYTSFGINIQTTTSTNPGPQAGFTTFDNATGFKLCMIEDSFKGLNITDRLSEVERTMAIVEPATNTDRVFKILTVGNSFSDDSDAYLYDIAKSAGIELIVGQVYVGGQSLEGHWKSANAGTTSGAYYKWRDGKKEITSSAPTLRTLFKDEEWDIITFQQASPLSGKYETFQPFLTNLIALARNNALNPKMKIALHMTWAYASNYAQLSGYEGSQLVMYNAITDAYFKALKANDIDIIIPSGTSIQNARTSSDLKAIGNELTRDGFHLDLGVGRLIAGLTFFETLLAGRFSKDIFAHVNVVPSTKFLAYLAKTAVRNAVNNPFKITEI